MNIKAYIIHLERASDRRENVERLVDSLAMPTTIISAADGRLLSDGDKDQHVRRQIFLPRYPFPLNTGEIACFLSHRLAWSKIVDDHVDAGLVLEDDVKITADFRDALEFARNVLANGDLMRFPHRDGKEEGQILHKSGNYKVIAPAPVGLGMVAQLVTRDAARQLLSITETFDRPVDVLTQMFWNTGVRPLSISPSGIREISWDLGGSTLKLRRPLFEKIGRAFQRAVYRRKIRRLSNE